MRSSGGGITFKFKKVIKQEKILVMHAVCYQDNQWQSMFDVEQEKAISIHLNRCLMIVPGIDNLIPRGKNQLSCLILNCLKESYVSLCTRAPDKAGILKVWSNNINIHK